MSQQPASAQTARAVSTGPTPSIVLIHGAWADDDGRWTGGSVTQWVEELTFAALECGAAAFIDLLPPGESISDTTLNRWAHEVVPAVREAIARR